MAIPDELFINGRWYEIEDCSGPAAEHNLMGQALYFDAKILLNLDLDLEAQLRTLVHEAWHIFAHDLGIEPNPNVGARECVAEFVSLFVHGLLSHNPCIAECYIPEEVDLCTCKDDNDNATED